MSKKLLIIGGTGLVGSTIIKYATKDYEIFATENNTPIVNPKVSSIKLDLLTNRKKIIDYIEKVKHVSMDDKSNTFNEYFIQTNQKMIKNVYNTYDAYINTKHKVKINYKTVERIKNYFR